MDSMDVKLTKNLRKTALKSSSARGHEYQSLTFYSTWQSFLAFWFDFDTSILTIQSVSAMASYYSDDEKQFSSQLHMDA